MDREDEKEAHSPSGYTPGLLRGSGLALPMPRSGVCFLSPGQFCGGVVSMCVHVCTCLYEDFKSFLHVGCCGVVIFVHVIETGPIWDSPDNWY